MVKGYLKVLVIMRYNGNIFEEVIVQYENDFVRFINEIEGGDLLRRDDRFDFEIFDDVYEEEEIM